MPTLVATAAATNANSYLSVADADTLADERLQVTNWTGEDADDKERALIMATRRLEQLSYEGEKSSSSQALKWPRQDAFDDNGDEYATDAIPTLVEQQTFEVALWLINENSDASDPLAPTGLEGFDRLAVGSVEVEPNHSEKAGSLPPNVLRALRPVLKNAGMTAELVRG